MSKDNGYLNLYIGTKDRWLFDEMKAMGESKNAVAILALKMFLNQSKDVVRKRYELEKKLLAEKHKAEMDALDLEYQIICSATPPEEQAAKTEPVAQVLQQSEPMSIWDSIIPESNPPKTYNEVYAQFTKVEPYHEGPHVGKPNPTSARCHRKKEQNQGWLTGRYGDKINWEKLYDTLMERCRREGLVK